MVALDPIELFTLIVYVAIFIFLFIVGLYNKFVMVFASIVSVFIAIQAWNMTENPIAPAFFIFIMALCISLSISKKG